MACGARVRAIQKTVSTDAVTPEKARIQRLSPRVLTQGGIPARKAERPERVRPFRVIVSWLDAYEQPLVEPQVSHFRQVPLRTMVKLPHSEQLSPS
jgi:hypothetical protein